MSVGLGTLDVVDVNFSPVTQAWFDAAFVEPTPAQAGAWQAVKDGDHTLVVAPTGSGKTLAAFLWSIDQLAQTPRPADPSKRCRVLYISPLKALAADIERNLRSPLTGIQHAAARLGAPAPDISVAMRTGDTPADERRAFVRQPPDILITTPESLFLLLTSAARDALAGVETVIVDEVHAVCGSKRGAHLALSLERLDELLDRPAQRIGLSATVRPTDEVARFLAGGRPVRVVQPPTTKTIELSVVVPVPDMSTLGQPTGDLQGAAAGYEQMSSIWPAVEGRVLDLIEQYRSTIVFVNSRRLAERLTARLNELAADRRNPELADVKPDHTKPPAELMGQSGAGGGTPAIVARAHHGSVSRQQRVDVEEALKAGQLPAVVATSSLELGIDMGAVDLVIQIESPPSVAAGLQRIGRGGHQVGAVSRGVLFPKYRGDLVECVVTAERMQSGEIEELRYPRNPLDVLAQQIVAMVATSSWRVEDLLTLVRRAAPFTGLPTSSFDAVLDMLSGRYPSDVFADLRPRLNWDRHTGELTGRPGAQRLAVTSGGTIPNRGLFGVFVVGEAGELGRRVGELDEEMVYESRVGDVFLLGSSSWRIEDITHDQVLVSPAPGEIGRMPFWHGDAVGRPAELGRALGAFVREVSTVDGQAATERVRAAGVDDWGSANLLMYLTEQRDATGALPTDRTIVVERFTDELGDWRVCIHSPFGARVNAPWALAVTARFRERYGVDVRAMHDDDGIVLRLPEMDIEAPPAELAIFDPAEIEELVTAELGGSAVFAARFRECAARALLLPRRDPRTRTPLWQQRQRAAQLLQVASNYGSFPIVLEAMRECLQDVFDVPALVELMRALQSRQIRLVEVHTPTPSPFARSLLFGYVGMFLYEGDAPLAERRAQALSLDTALLAELLGQTELRELLDPEAIEEIEQDLQWLSDKRRAYDLDSTADLLRIVGDLSGAEAELRGARPEWLTELAEHRRVLSVRIAGEQRWIAIEDAGRVRDALGVALPVGVPEQLAASVADPLGDVIGRYARTHGPFRAEQCAARLGLGTAVVTEVLARLSASGRVVAGEFRAGNEWCDAEVLRQLRRRSLAKLRREVEPVPAITLARFLPAWQHIGSASGGFPALEAAIEQLAGVAVPASALESLILPARVAGYEPGMLDQLTSSGEVLWAGTGSLPGNDGWITVAPAESADLLLPDPIEPELTPLHERILNSLQDSQALFFRDLSDRVYSGGELGHPDDTNLADALWDLVWASLVTNDTLAPLRSRLSGTRNRPRRSNVPRPRLGRRPIVGRPTMPSRTGPPQVSGRWWKLPARELDPTRRAHAAAEALLNRHGVLTRGAIQNADIPGGFAGVYPVLRAFEESGHCRRGYFVESLGAAQFAVNTAVDRLRSFADPRRKLVPAVVLAATDPANPYGAALPWPDRPSSVNPSTMDGPQRTIDDGGSIGERGHRPGRKAGAVVVLVDGELVLYVERGGRTVLSWTDEVELLQPAADALALTVRDGGLGRLTVQKADGMTVHGSVLADALEAAGFQPTPQGLRLRS